ncbi:MAG: hypothetical protein QOH21_3522, partial [Acidobacteriota bacterium]|nr:hypothetical protein [Acidobacteriota bacterium]
MAVSARLSIQADSGSFEVRKAIPQDNSYLKNYAFALGLSALYVIGVGIKMWRGIRMDRPRPIAKHD